MKDKINITICLGSSCFSRKNRDVVAALQDYIGQNKLENEIYLKGGHCFGKCSLGPIMIVEGDFYHEITPTKAIAIVETYLNQK